MSTKDIRTSNAYTVCDVCGRTLLRGERAEVYLNGGTRRSVCELCKERALHEGWIREGTVPPYDEGESSSDRRRSLFGRLRGRREAGASTTSTLRDELDGSSWSERAPEPRSVPRAMRDPVREPRHVRAVPTSVEQKQASAVEFFNGSEHCRTIAGVARSLGPPGVSVHPSSTSATVVNIVAYWELCWYRYEIDLSDDEPSVRVAGQGYELAELDAEQLNANASADEQGSLALGT